MWILVERVEEAVVGIVAVDEAVVVGEASGAADAIAI